MQQIQLKILVVDDESPARKKLSVFLKNTAQKLQILEAGNGIDAVGMIHSHQPDIVFLDIQMPGLTGFGVIEAIGVTNMPPVVFVTAYDEHAIAAFEVEAIDYLLKPFDEERFQKSFQRIMKKIQSKTPTDENLEKLVRTLNQKSIRQDRLMVHKGGKFFFIKMEQIVYFSAAEKYINLHTPDGDYLLRRTMNSLEETMPPAQFVRVHRSYIVNVDFIREIHPWSHGDYQIVLQTGQEIPLSRRYKDRLFKT